MLKRLNSFRLSVEARDSRARNSAPPPPPPSHLASPETRTLAVWERKSDTASLRSVSLTHTDSGNMENPENPETSAAATAQQQGGSRMQRVVGVHVGTRCTTVPPPFLAASRV